MTIAEQIKQAIARSISHNEIVHITIDGDGADALSEIQSQVDCEVDHVETDYEGVDTMDIWGFDESAAQGEMLWRLAIRFAGEAEPCEDE